MKGSQATVQELEEIGRELVRRRRTLEYLVEEDQSGHLRLLVRDRLGKERSPLDPKDPEVPG
jgi:hypothetical protein